MSLDVRQWFKDVVCEHEEAYQFDVENLVKDNSLGNWMILDHLSYLCYTIAIKKLILENDVIGYKQQLYKAGRYFELYVLAEPLNVPSHPRYVKGENCFKGTANYYGDLYSALISQNPELIVSLAHLLGWRGEEEDFKINDLNPENGHLGYAIKYIILQEDNKARAHLEALSRFRLHRYQKVDMEQRMAVLEGILDQDQEKVHDGLKQILRRHKKRIKQEDILGKFYDNAVAGLGWLAQYRGIKIEINDKLCPKEIFEYHEFPYPELEWIPEDLRDKTWEDLVQRRY
ncbi:immunity 49 family protein [Thermoactinomyces daqus]|uniref:Immunity 49 family protein n=1 Tax=Thermoactinomyces daqus TaxID=1329516 RepID=A0A7W2AIT4_9BACL|nr:immunity 49 family protein [Thermoactinomyces daqus]MBA4544602.1 immunity 49 family protein [Thermoactinomyces daqus]